MATSRKYELHDSNTSVRLTPRPQSASAKVIKRSRTIASAHRPQLVKRSLTNVSRRPSSIHRDGSDVKVSSKQRQVEQLQNKDVIMPVERPVGNPNWKGSGYVVVRDRNIGAQPDSKGMHTSKRDLLVLHNQENDPRYGTSRRSKSAQNTTSSRHRTQDTNIATSIDTQTALVMDPREPQSKLKSIAGRLWQRVTDDWQGEDGTSWIPAEQKRLPKINSAKYFVNQYDAADMRTVYSEGDHNTLPSNGQNVVWQSKMRNPLKKIINERQILSSRKFPVNTQLASRKQPNINQFVTPNEQSKNNHSRDHIGSTNASAVSTKLSKSVVQSLLCCVADAELMTTENSSPTKKPGPRTPNHIMLANISESNTMSNNLSPEYHKPDSSRKPSNTLLSKTSYNDELNNNYWNTLPISSKKSATDFKILEISSNHNDSNNDFISSMKNENRIPATSRFRDTLVTQKHNNVTDNFDSLQSDSRVQLIPASLFASNTNRGSTLPSSVKSRNKYILPPLQKHEIQRNCLIIDLDETLVHSSFKPPPRRPDWSVPVQINGIRHTIYVLVRPHTELFLRNVAQMFECVLFTASLAKYADPVADYIDPYGSLGKRLFREHCIYHRGNYVKDLSRLGRDLNRVVIIDNSPSSFAFHPQNALRVNSWYGNKTDTELRDILPLLRTLADSNDVCETLRREGVSGPYNRF